MARHNLWESISKNGFYVLHLQGDAVFRLRLRLAGPLKIKSLTHYCPDNAASAAKELMRRASLGGEWKDILLDNYAELCGVVGDDFLVEKEPYIRIDKPGIDDYAQGLHRDLSAHEWVFWLPLTHAIDGAELKLGSHVGEAPLRPIPCPVGSAIIFNGACVRELPVNKASWPRITLGLRLIGPEAPIDKDVYAPLLELA